MSQSTLSHLQPNQQRVVIEREELFDKITRLTEFTARPAFLELPDLEVDLMLMQLNAMNVYSQILAMRISAWESGCSDK